MLDLPLPKPLPANEPVLNYAPGSPERAALKSALARLSGEKPDVPHVIGGKEHRDGAAFDVKAPHDHSLVVAVGHEGGHAMTEKAIAAALAAAPAWAAMSFEERARIFLKAADLLAGPWRQTVNAATMLGQSKTAYQAEIDAACELIDFLRFNVSYASQLAEQQPHSPPGTLNAMELRPLEGFILAVTPFNFTAIAGNLPSVCALMGNVVVWKPAENQVLAAYHTMKLFEAAGLPPGVINVVHGDGAKVSEVCLASPHLAGIHFTGSTRVFQALWRGVGENIGRYRSYPRIVGETGGKDFVFAHPSADLETLAVALVRGAYEYQGQKCSAASRAYIPKSLWPKLKERVLDQIGQIKMGDVKDFRNFMSAVINERAWTRLDGWRQRLASDPSVTVHTANGWSRETGWFCGTIRPAPAPRVRGARRGALRPRPRGERLRGHPGGGDARSHRPHVAVRAHGRGLRAGSRRGLARDDAPSPGGWQHLHQRQAHGRGRRAAAVRRRARFGHERQGRQRVQPSPLGEPARDEGDARGADLAVLPLHAGRVSGRTRSSLSARSPAHAGEPRSSARQISGRRA